MPRCSPRTVLNTNYVMGNGSSTLLYNGAVCKRERRGVQASIILAGGHWAHCPHMGQTELKAPANIDPCRARLQTMQRLSLGG